MKPELARQIADALECTPEFLPILPELLADLEELGASRQEIVELLRPVGLAPGSRVLDLGCGKGAVLLELAAELELCGVGVDGFRPFVEAARDAAGSRGLGARCTFRCADLHEAAAEARDFDVAMMLGVGLAVGDQSAIVALLRGCVRPGGYLVVDDAFLPDGLEAPPPEYAGYADHATTIARLCAHGDVILQEERTPPEQTVRRIHEDTEKIRRRAQALARRRPDLASAIEAYVQRQEREADLARSHIIDALWLLHRA